MENLTKKQKIIFWGMFGVMCLIIIYYLFEQWQTPGQETFEISNVEEQVQEKVKKNIVVHVTGCVEKEGIVELEEESRIADAIEKAGGATSDANLSKINLAYKLKDGQKIYVPSIIENEEVVTIMEKSDGIDNRSNKENKEKVNINTATQAELETLPRYRPINGTKDT